VQHLDRQPVAHGKQPTWPRRRPRATVFVVSAA
jgi:hypothetical protein